MLSFIEGHVRAPRDHHPADVLLVDLQLLQGRNPRPPLARLRRHLPRVGQAVEVRRISKLVRSLLRRIRGGVDRHQALHLSHLDHLQRGS